MPPRFTISPQAKQKIVAGIGDMFARVAEAAVDAALENVEEVLDNAGEKVRAKRKKTRRPSAPR